MLKNRGIIRNQNRLNQTRDNFVISSYFPPKLTPTTTIPTQSITFLVPKKKKKKKNQYICTQILFSSLLSMELKRPQTQTQIAILSFTCFSLFIILTVGLDDQVLALLPPPTTKASGGERYVQMRAGAAFKIAVFADLHFGENAWTDWGPVQDVNSVKVMNTVLDNETTTGDFITSFLINHVRAVLS